MEDIMKHAKFNLDEFLDIFTYNKMPNSMPLGYLKFNYF